MLTIGSLFAGIGGLELGLERAGLGPTLWEVESDPYCRAVLARHWPDAKRYNDVRTVGADLAAVDIICGGFPCQDVSSAGSRAGLAGSRSGLWREFARVVGVVRPRWIVVENVASGATRWMDAVVSDLEQLGYACLPLPIAASDVGAPHRRARIFIVARHVDCEGQPSGAVDAEVGGAPSVVADAHCLSKRVPKIPRWQEATECLSNSYGTTEPDMVRVVHGVSRRLDSPSRRIRALGNSVVPQCAEVVGHVIRELL